MKKSLLFLLGAAFTLVAFTTSCKKEEVTPAPEVAKEVTETINITCWSGYANANVIDAFKALVKEKHNVNVEVKTFYPTMQDEFYQAAKNGTADLISPPADLAKTPRFYCFNEGDLLLAEIDPANVPNLQHLLPFFADDTSLTHNGKLYVVPYNCGPYGLAYNTDVVKEAPTSWNILWDPMYAGKYTITGTFPKCNFWIAALAMGHKYEDIFDIAKLDKAKLQKKVNTLVKNAKNLPSSWKPHSDYAFL